MSNNNATMCELFNSTTKENYMLYHNTNIIEKVIIDKKNKNKNKYINFGDFSIVEKILYINTNNNENIIYYNIDNKYYNKKYINKYFKIIKININEQYFEAILYKANMIYIPQFISLDGKYEIIDNILIINWENGVIFFHKKIDDIFVKKEIPDFDIEFYKKKINNNLNNWYDIAKYWLINENEGISLHNDKSKIKIDNNIYDIVINHSHLHIHNTSLNIYYKFEFHEDESLNVNINFFTIQDNNVIFSTDIHEFKTFKKINDIYE